MTTATATPAGIEVPAEDRGEVLFRDTSHRERDTCPDCSGYLGTTGLPDLAYVFTGCDCAHVDYVHLYEQLWHLECLRKPEPAA